MAEKPKYTTLDALRRAYSTGELSREDNPLVIDNDSSHVYLRGEDPDGLDDVKVFGGPGPEVLLEEALDLLDIPHTGA